MLDVQTLSDRVELQDLLYKYYRCLDTCAWNILRDSVLVEDVEFQVSATDADGALDDGTVGRDAFLVWLEAANQGITAYHLPLSLAFELGADSATSESPMIVIDRLTLATLATGEVRVDYVRRPEGWRIRRLGFKERVVSGASAGMKSRVDDATAADPIARYD